MGLTPQPNAIGYTPEQEADILKFYPPPAPTPEQTALIVDIVSLDHRLAPQTRQRQEVKRLLWNAINASFERRDHFCRPLSSCSPSV